MSVAEDDIYPMMLSWRDLEAEDACRRCQGSGVCTYGSTATWTGGIGGQMITSGICDLCWGSGSMSRPWTDLRKLRDEHGLRVRLEAANLLAKSVGIGLSHLSPALLELSDDLRRLSKGRRTKPRGFYGLCGYLADQLKAFSEAPLVGRPKLDSGDDHVS